MSGEMLDLNIDANILAINAPKKFLDGPYVVVYKNLQERWAIVALKWENQPRLGIRWFWGSAGNPFSSGNATWLVVPPTLSKGILASLPLNHAFCSRIDRFLSGELGEDQLM